MRVFICLFLFLAISCSNNDADTSNSCVPILIDDSKFNSTENDVVNLLEFTLEGYCLKVNLGVSGCDANHIIDMVYDGSILESFPPQVIFDFYDNNPQQCEAYFEIERKYDLSSLLNSSTDEIVVRFRDNDISFRLMK